MTWVFGVTERLRLEVMSTLMKFPDSPSKVQPSGLSVYRARGKGVGLRFQGSEFSAQGYTGFRFGV